MRLAAALSILAILLTAVPSRAVEPSPASTPAALSIDQRYEKALNLYELGDYDKAAKELKAFIDDAPVGYDKAKLKRAWLYRGISLFLLSDRPGADKAFWEVLRLDPLFHPDPLFTLPAIIDAFNKLGVDHADELREMRKGAGGSRSDTPRDALGIPLGPTDPTRNFIDAISPVMPLGYAQYKNHQSGKALALGLSEGGMVLVIAGTYASFQTLRKPGNHFHTDEVNAARLDKAANNGAYVILIAELVYGAIDGVYYSGRARSPVPPDRRVPSFVSGPGTAGIGMEWRF